MLRRIFCCRFYGFGERRAGRQSGNTERSDAMQYVTPGNRRLHAQRLVARRHGVLLAKETRKNIE